MFRIIKTIIQLQSILPVFKGSFSIRFDSGFAFNLGGRVNLLYCFFWGIAAVVWLKLIYPLLSNLIEKLPLKLMSMPVVARQKMVSVMSPRKAPMKNSDTSL